MNLSDKLLGYFLIKSALQNLLSSSKWSGKYFTIPLHRSFLKSAPTWTAPLIANVFFRQTALLPLLRGSCCLIPVIAAAHVCGGIMNALGLQGASLKISLAASLLGVLAVLLLVPVVGLWGAVASLGAVQGLTLLLSLRALRRSGCIARSR